MEKLKALKSQLGSETTPSSMDSSKVELQDKIKAQGDVVRKLKADKAEKSLVRIQ